VLTIQGELASESDRRTFDLFTWREPPLTLRVQTEDFGGHDGASPVASIDGLLTLSDGRRVWGWGTFSDTEAGVTAETWVGEGVLRGVSVDPGEYTYVEEITDPEGNLVTMEQVYELYALADEALDDGDEDAYGEVMAQIDALQWRLRFTSYEIAAATLVATPAFKDAKIALVPDGEEPAMDEAAASAAANALLATPKAPVADRLASLRSGRPRTAAERLAALLGERAGTLLASAPDGTTVAHFNPGRTIAAPGATFTGTGTASTRQAASGPARLRAEWFRPLEGEAAAARPRWTITDEGRILGYLYSWDDCHRSFGTCERPTVQQDFPEFHTGLAALDDGTRLAVGALTYMDLHAGDGPPDPTVLQRLMEDTGQQLGPVRLYADEFGVQCCGQVYDDVTPTLVARALAGFPSGDWRDVLNGDGWRLYGLHVVNTPGYPWRVDGEAGARMVASMASRPQAGVPAAASSGCGCSQAASSCGCSRSGRLARLSPASLADLAHLDAAVTAGSR
jgi:hypothetical protein